MIVYNKNITLFAIDKLIQLCWKEGPKKGLNFRIKTLMKFLSKFQFLFRSSVSEPYLGFSILLANFILQDYNTAARKITW